MAYSHPIFEILFLCSVSLIWAMIFYQILFTYFGYMYHQRALKEKKVFNRADVSQLPPVSILIPAHNEELVIKKTLQSLLSLDYPSDSLEIIVINDGSTDNTPDIVSEISMQDNRVRLLNIQDKDTATGKPHALNFGLKEAQYNLIAVYDADNNPEPDSLKYLVLTLCSDNKIVSTFGKFRTINKHRNLLTRFINLETLSFQFIIQAGRYFLSRIAILPGTNFVIYKDIVVQAGGWDENALTEDTELSIRLYEKGHEIKFVPYAVTWEEEPETWGAWLRQRTRWVRGNFYVLRKYLIPSFKLKKIGLTIELIYLFLLYYLFLGSILLSHLIFVASSLGLISVLLPGPYILVWICAFIVFLIEITLAISYEGEATPRNIGMIVIMYFTYCQAWLVLVFRAIYQEYIQKGKVNWEKTRRFGSDYNEHTQ